MNKKGQGLSLNMVVVAVIVLVVLFVVIAFFSGGFTAIAEKVGNIFKGGIDDRAVSIQLCNTYCLTAKRYDDQTQIDAAKFCKAKFSIDRDGDGTLSDNERERPMSCNDLNVRCIGSTGRDVTCTITT